MTPEQDERMVVAAERTAAAFESLASAAQSIAAAAESTVGSAQQIADAVEFGAMTFDAWFAFAYPPKQPPREVEITHLKTEEELIREKHGGEDAAGSLSDWLTLDGRAPAEDRWSQGPREKAYAESEPGEKQSDGPAGSPRRGTPEVPD